MRFDKETNELQISVSELVSLAYPAGDIHAGGMGAPRVSASMRVALVEALSESQVETEVSLSASFLREEITSQEGGEAFSETDSDASLQYTIVLSGDADAIVRSEGGEDVIYHLMPTGGYDRNGTFRTRHRAQAKAIAALYCIAANVGSVELCEVTSAGGSSRLLLERAFFKKEMLTGVLMDLLSRVRSSFDFLVKHKTVTVPKAGEVYFPYKGLRDGQEELIRAVYRAMRRGHRLFAQAPTGIGKTISTLYPAVKAIGDGHIDKVFYLTAKASTRHEAFMAAGRLFHAGARLRTCVITAKEQVCLCKNEAHAGDRCNPYDCPYADGYYERSAPAILSLLSRQHGFTRTCIEETAREYEVCPYELSLDLSEKCDIIICDYNYIFDPVVYFRRYFGSERTFDGKYAFLIDEGHNLADRARDMYSISLHSKHAAALLERLPEECAAVRTALKALTEAFDGLKTLCSDTLSIDAEGFERGFWMGREVPAAIEAAIEKSFSACKEWMRGASRHPMYREILSFAQELRLYRRLRDYYDEKFLTMVRVLHGNIELRLFCLDPSEVIHECLSRAHSSVIFSATLTPQDYFTDLFGGGRRSQYLSLPSPFPRENLCVAVCDAVSTRFETRQQSYRAIASLIAASVSKKNGNYIVYFPSYAYLEDVFKIFSGRYPMVETIVQRRGMSVSEREAFLNAFLDDGRLRVGFCVLGGSFSEGVDLPGSRLIGTVIVGVGLAGLSEEGNILRDYYENKCEAGYDYAYTFPGMNRVLQAAGRVIRTENDRGIVVLIDDRYATPTYRRLFPLHWENVQYAGNSRSLAEITRRFWENTQK